MDESQPSTGERFDRRELVFDGVLLLFATPLVGLLPSGPLDESCPRWLAVDLVLVLQLLLAVFVGWTTARYTQPDPSDPGTRRFEWIGKALGAYALFALFFFLLPAGLEEVGPFAFLMGLFYVAVGGGAGYMAYGPEYRGADEKAEAASETPKRRVADLIGIIVAGCLILGIINLGGVASDLAGAVGVILLVFVLLVLLAVTYDPYEKRLVPALKRVEARHPGRIQLVSELILAGASALSLVLLERIYLTNALIGEAEPEPVSYLLLLAVVGLLPIRLLLLLAPPLKLANLPVAIGSMGLFLLTLVW